MADFRQRLEQNAINRSEWENAGNWHGFFYFSTNDTRILVPSRIPLLGLTLNLGTLTGAISFGCLLLLMLLFLLIPFLLPGN